MEKVIGVEKAAMLVRLYNQANTIDTCAKLLQQQRMAIVEKIYSACDMLDVPVDSLKVLLVEGKVEWPDPIEKEEEEAEKE